MALSHKIKAAIKGSIASPEAAQKVIEAIEASAGESELAEKVEDLEEAQGELASKVEAAGELAPLAPEAELADAVAKVNELIAALKG